MRSTSYRLEKGKMFIFTTIVILIGLAGCTTTPPPKAQPTETKPPPSAEAGPSEPTTAPPTEALEPTEEPGLPPLSAEPQRVEFQAEDGKNLVGFYYPGATNPAPAVILLHWARGDQRDWIAIAPWLQNRPDELADFPDWAGGIGPDCEAQSTGPWLDPSWFPPMPESLSLGVFTFDFRNFCESATGMDDPGDWLLDANAAFATVIELPGVDPHQIVAIGASIGSDGAPDGCLLHNQENATCLGAFSLSPGSYLTMDYAAVVTDLDGDVIPPKVPVWCLAAEGDPNSSADICRSASGDLYQTIIYPGDAHGMMLLVPDLDPDPMVLIQDFLEETLGVIIN